MSLLGNPWTLLGAALLGAAGGGFAAFELGRAPLQTDLANLRMEYAALRERNADNSRLAAQASSARIQAAQARSDALTRSLSAAQAEAKQLAKEKAHAIRTATDGRACLSDRALRVLNGAPGLAVSGIDRLPPASGQPVATDARVATDTDIGSWAITAAGQYEACRERLQSLIDWHTATESDSTAHEPHREPAQP
jgi:hypothetical protein